MGNADSSIEIRNQQMYYVIFCTTKYHSFAEAKEKAPQLIAAHIKRSKELHEKGILFLSGAFIEDNGKPLSTMGILASYEAAEDYIKGDPFVLAGVVQDWYIRKWANMFI